MTPLLSLLAAASQPAGGPVPWYVSFFQNPLLVMVAVLAIFYFFMIRTKRTEENQRKEMLSALKKGDRVQTIGGILGTVIEARESEVVVKVDESSNTKLRLVRSAIHRVLGEDKPAAK